MFNVSGIKCDNKLCDFKDMSVKFEDYPKWLNRRCPCCTDNLLTEKDFKLVSRMDYIFNNRVFKFLGKATGIFSFGKEKSINVEFDLNGSGKMKVKKVTLD
jgi:hypothetical protein